MGKTALLRYFWQRINRDWGYTEYNGFFSALVVYVSFPNQVDRRYMEQLALSALVDICKSGVLDASRAALRIRELPEEQARKIMLQSDGSEDPANILSSDSLRDHGADPGLIDESIRAKLIQQGVSRDSAAALSKGEFEDYLKSFRKDHSLEPLYVPRDTKILDYSRRFLFDDVVLYLMASGFAGGYLFVDDIENLVDQMSRKHRNEFAKELALCTVRPGYANGKYNFFSSVLTTHLQASISLASAWGEAGLAGIARLDPNDPNSVELPLPNADEARSIAVAHLDYYRKDPQDKGTIKPFTEDGMTALLKNSQHPRILLTTAASVVSRAADEGLTFVDAPSVERTIEASKVQPIPDFTEGIDGAV